MGIGITKFLGSMEKRDGFIEIRDEWETVARIADLNGSDMLSWDELQAAVDAAGNLLYPGILEAWTNVSSFFPEVATFDDDHSGDSSDGGPGQKILGLPTPPLLLIKQCLKRGVRQTPPHHGFAPETLGVTLLPNRHYRSYNCASGWLLRSHGDHSDGCSK